MAVDRGMKTVPRPLAERGPVVFDRIAANPQLHPVVFADIRQAIVARFPYCVFV
jgi:hypothetical protein